MLRAIYAVNPENVSKVVDENGEPKVVWHGTNAEFDIRAGEANLSWCGPAVTPRFSRFW